MLETVLAPGQLAPHTGSCVRQFHRILTDHFALAVMQADRTGMPSDWTDRLIDRRSGCSCRPVESREEAIAQCLTPYPGTSQLASDRAMVNRQRSCQVDPQHAALSLRRQGRDITVCKYAIASDES